MYMRCVHTCSIGGSAGDTGRPTHRYRPRQQLCSKALTMTPLSVTPFSSCSSDLPVSGVAFIKQCHCTRRPAVVRVSNGSDVIADKEKKRKKEKSGGKSFQSDFVVSVCACLCWCSGILVSKYLLSQRTSCSWCNVNCMYHIHPENINKAMGGFCM